MPSMDSTIAGTSGIGITEAQVYAAIADVLDPELDESLVKLGFIDQVQVDGPDVSVVFRLPTYWCSPNFAYLMAEDLRARVRALPGVRTVRVMLLDHCSEDEINSGINAGLSFPEAFQGEATEDLEELRRIFLRKGFLMRQDALLRQMLKVGLDEAAIRSLRMANLTVDEASDAAIIRTSDRAVRLEGLGRKALTYLRRGTVLGLLQGPDDPLITDDQGQPIAPGDLQDFLRRSRSIRMNIMFNTSFCTSMFQTRYGRKGALPAPQDGLTRPTPTVEGDLV